MRGEMGFAGDMCDASEVLSAIFESLSMVKEGQKLVKELFEWQVTPPPPTLPSHTPRLCSLLGGVAHTSALLAGTFCTPNPKP